jgi:putative transposase
MARKSVKRAFRYRFYPTDVQAAELSRTFGCVRLVYNRALAERTTVWRTEQRRLSYADSSAAPTAWKRTEELSFLTEVSCVPLQQTLRHLHTAFGNFFDRRARYPRFKSKKKSRASAEYTRSAFRYRDGQLTLAKMTEPLGIVWSRPLPEGACPSTVTVSRDAAGRWFVSLLCEDTVEQPLAANDAVGVDAGITSVVTLSTGEKVANPRYERRERSPSSSRSGRMGRSRGRQPVASCTALATDAATPTREISPRPTPAPAACSKPSWWKCTSVSGTSPIPGSR